MCIRDRSVTIGCQVYFKRYSQPTQAADGTVPENYSKATNLDALFEVYGTAELNGVYLDGHSLAVENEALGHSSPAVEANAPLVRVQPGGYLRCSTESVTLNGKNCSVDSTLFTNNRNIYTKEGVYLPDTATSTNPDGTVEGSGAGLEIQMCIRDSPLP